MNTDPIADMLTRIRNAASSRRELTTMPYSKIKEAIARILKDNNYIADFGVDTTGAFKQLRIDLNTEQTVITDLKRISKPGRRVYASSQDIPSVLAGHGIVIVSTPKGLMTGKQARKAGLGGELICKVS
jgi:small subunit ribosomal protein S8